MNPQIKEKLNLVYGNWLALDSKIRWGICYVVGISTGWFLGSL